MSVKILNEFELRKAVGIDHASLDCVAESFGWLSDGRAMVPPVAHLDASEHHGEVDIKTAYVRGVERFAVKIASGFPENARLGLPTGSGMMVVFSSRTGLCEAVLLDNGYLTDLRTGLAGAVAAQWLAPKEPDVIGILGTGVQARYQLLCLALVRKIKTVLAWGRSDEHLKRYVEEMDAEHGIRIQATKSIEDLVRRSQLLITVTASRSALIRADWLHPGLHITAVGADFPGKGELEPAVLERADRLYCDRLEQCRRLGELQHWRGARPLEAYELGAVVRGAAPGRQSEGEITVCDLAALACRIPQSRIALARSRRAWPIRSIRVLTSQS